MKSFLATLALTLLLTLTTAASHAAPIKIDCVFQDPENKDHILIQHNNSQTGTFTYATEAEVNSSNAGSDKLELRRVTSDDQDFAKWLATREEVQFYFVMPSNLVMRTSQQFAATLIIEIPVMDISNPQSVKCSAKL